MSSTAAVQSEDRWGAQSAVLAFLVISLAKSSIGPFRLRYWTLHCATPQWETSDVLPLRELSSLIA